MQLTNLPDNKILTHVENLIQPERLGRYLPAANGDKFLSFTYYLWNCDLSQSFYIPLHFAEIGCRNAIHNALLTHLGIDWYEKPVFIRLLSERFQRELKNAVIDEEQQHGAKLTAHHVVSALTFGFWEHLLTKRFDRILWKDGLQPYFLGLPANINRDQLRTRIESVRRWRNRIAHHRAIFDKSPSKKYTETIQLLSWACPHTSGWVKSVSHVQTIINKRP